MSCFLGSVRSAQRSSHRQRAPAKCASAHVSQHGCTPADPLVYVKLFRFHKKGSALRVPCQPWKPRTEDRLNWWALNKEAKMQAELEEQVRRLLGWNYVPVNSFWWINHVLGIISRHVRIRGPGGVTDAQMLLGLINGTTRFTIEPAPREVTSRFFHALEPKQKQRISGKLLVDRVNQTEYLVKNREQLCQIIQLQLRRGPNRALGRAADRARCPAHG